MGNCCRKKSRESESRLDNGSVHSIRYSRSTVIPKGLFLICLDISPTAESSRLKTALKGAFGGIVSYNREKTLLEIVQLPEIRKYIVVIIGKVQEKTLTALVDSPNVSAVYLCLGKPRTDQIPQSNKIKGVFPTRQELQHAIQQDFYSN